MKKVIEVGDRSEGLALGERVYVKPYDCFGKVVRVEWRKELKLRSNFVIPEGFIYWVKLEDKDLKPQAFSSKCLKKN